MHDEAFHQLSRLATAMEEAQSLERVERKANAARLAHCITLKVTGSDASLPLQRKQAGAQAHRFGTLARRNELLPM